MKTSRPTRWTDEAKEEALKMYVEGVRTDIIAAKYGVTTSAIWCLAHRRGIKKQKEGQRKFVVPGNKKHKAPMKCTKIKPRVSAVKTDEEEAKLRKEWKEWHDRKPKIWYL